MKTKEESLKELENLVNICYTNDKHKFIVVTGRWGGQVIETVTRVFEWFYYQPFYTRITIGEFNDHEVTFEKK